MYAGKTIGAKVQRNRAETGELDKILFDFRWIPAG